MQVLRDRPSEQVRLGCHVTDSFVILAQVKLGDVDTPYVTVPPSEGIRREIARQAIDRPEPISPKNAKWLPAGIVRDTL